LRVCVCQRAFLHLGEGVSGKGSKAPDKARKTTGPREYQAPVLDGMWTRFRKGKRKGVRLWLWECELMGVVQFWAGPFGRGLCIASTGEGFRRRNRWWPMKPGEYGKLWKWCTLKPEIALSVAS
jgi:hypothetical protein